MEDSDRTMLQEQITLVLMEEQDLTEAQDLSEVQDLTEEQDPTEVQDLTEVRDPTVYQLMRDRGKMEEDQSGIITEEESDLLQQDQIILVLMQVLDPMRLQDLIMPGLMEGSGVMEEDQIILDQIQVLDKMLEDQDPMKLGPVEVSDLMEDLDLMMV